MSESPASQMNTTATDKPFEKGLFDSENVTAYAKLQGNGILYYIQDLEISLGKKFNTKKYVDVPLGASPSISRIHAFLAYNQDTSGFEIEVKGNSGLYVDEEFYKKGETVPLKHKSKIQIGNVHVWFLLPDPPKVQDNSDEVQDNLDEVQDNSDEVEDNSDEVQDNSDEVQDNLDEETTDSLKVMRISNIVNNVFDGSSDLSEQDREIEFDDEMEIDEEDKGLDENEYLTDEQDDEVFDPYGAIEMYRSCIRRPPFPYFVMVSHALYSLKEKSTVKDIADFLCEFSPYYRRLYQMGFHRSIRAATNNGKNIKFRKFGSSNHHEYSLAPDEYHIKKVRIIVRQCLARLAQKSKRPIQQQQQQVNEQPIQQEQQQVNDLPAENTEPVPEENDDLPAESTEPILDQQNQEAEDSQVGEETRNTRSDPEQHLDKDDIENPTESMDTSLEHASQLDEQDGEKPTEAITEQQQQQQQQQEEEEEEKKEEMITENMDTSLDVPQQSNEQDSEKPVETAIIDPKQVQEQQQEEEITPEKMDHDIDQENEHPQRLSEAPLEGMDSEFDPFKVIASFKYTDQNPVFETNALITYILYEKSRESTEPTGMTNHEITEKLLEYFPYYKSQYKAPWSKVAQSMKYRRRYIRDNSHPKKCSLIPYHEFKSQFEDEVRSGMEQIKTNENANNKRPIENDDQQIDTPASKKQKSVDSTSNTTEKPIIDTPSEEKSTIAVPPIKLPDKNTIISISTAIAKIKVKSPPSSTTDKFIINTIKDLFELTTRRGRSALVKTLAVKLQQRIHRYLYNPIRYPLTQSMLDTLPEAVSYLPADDVRKIANSIEDSMSMGLVEISPALPKAFGLTPKLS